MPADRASSLTVAEPARSPESADALVRAEAAQTVPDLYDAWLKLKLARGQSASAFAQEEKALSQRAEYLLRSVEAARSLSGPGASGGSSVLASGDPLGEFQRGAQRELEAARAALAERRAREEGVLAEQIAKVQQLLRQRVETMLALQPPQVTLLTQPVGSEQCLVQLARPEPEEAVALCLLLSGKLPTRRDAFFDDSIDELGAPPARFYVEEGVERSSFESADDEDSLVADPLRPFVPVKAFIPFRIPGHDFPRFRVVNRGPLAPVLARCASGGYQELMSRTQAELLSGYFIRLQVEGRLKLALRLG